MKAAPRPDLVACAVAAVTNAQGLLADAELLSEAGHRARACSLAVLAIEEVGKAVSMLALSLVPEKLKGQARVGRMLEWHELKLAGGLLVGLLPQGEGSAVARLASIPRTELARMVRDSDLVARNQDRLKLAGLYVDMDHQGSVRQPSEVTEADVADQLGRAKQAVQCASVLLDPSAPTRQARPPKESVQFAVALVQALADAGSGRTTKDAVDIMVETVNTLGKQAGT